MEGFKIGLINYGEGKLTKRQKETTAEKDPFPSFFRLSPSPRGPGATEGSYLIYVKVRLNEYTPEETVKETFSA